MVKILLKKCSIGKTLKEKINKIKNVLKIQFNQEKTF